MLCDTITQADYLSAFYPGFNRVRDVIVKARKFVLAPDITAAADGLVNNLSQLEKIAPFCRLPFENCWFELAQADRPHFITSKIDHPDFQGKPTRVGFLCVANGNKLWNWRTTLYWSINDPKADKANVSMLCVTFNTKEPIELKNDMNLGQYIDVNLAHFVPPEAAFIPKLRDLAASDWGGEVRYLMALLGLLNSRNVAEHHEVDNTTYNKKRVKAGKLPLASHTLLKIRAIHKHAFARPGRPPLSHDEIRRHFVVGHWKTRKTGLFWWNPFMRGKAERGLVTHDYEITE